MQEKLLAGAIRLLAAWCFCCLVAYASNDLNRPKGDSPIFVDTKIGTVPLPLLTSAGNIPTNELRFVIEPPFSGLEQKLFADAGDGRLDDFSLLDAAMIAGGVDNIDELNRCRERIAAWADQLRQGGKLGQSPRQQVEAIFEFLHREILHGRYDITCTDLRQAFGQGNFNCVSATVLFNCLAGELGLSCSALETPGHALSRVFLSEGPVDVETTCPSWFHLQHDPVRQAEALEKTIGHNVSNNRKLREISNIQLTAMIYYNRGVDFLAEKRFADAAAANAKALRLDPLNDTARGNFLATLNNWSIELSTAGRYAEAASLIRQGLVFDPHYEAFTLNFMHVHHQWSQQLCKEGQYREAADLLNQAASEMPDREYFRRAVWDVYRHWSLSLFEAREIDKAFEVFNEARSRHGACREELDCELSAVVEYGKKLIAQDRYDEARQVFDRVLILQPEASIPQDNRRVVAEKTDL
jgi:tetratricopeptide (TPR) repeat protein